MQAARAYWQHLRLPFQLTLAPLFLWGCYLAPDRFGAGKGDAILGSIALHLFLYPGVTAFNSAYDRDTGPVAGMLCPPQVPPGLLPFSILWQAAGALLAGLVGATFLALYAAIALLAFAYSHPVTRWKADPVRSTLAVGLGQGALGFLAGWCAGAGDLGKAAGLAGLAGAMVAALTTIGLYPATQVFQIEEDAGRGDRTLAVVLGAPGALRLGSACLAAAAAIAAWLVAGRTGIGDGIVLAGIYLAVIGHNEIVARRLATPRTVHYAYVQARRTGTIATTGFLLFVACQVGPW